MATVDDALRTQIANIEASSGRTMGEWRILAQERGLAKHGAIMAWLKGEHAMTHGSANRVALEVLRVEPSAEAGSVPTDPADAIYTGKGTALRPLHDAIVEYARSLGPDVQLAPKKAWISLRRGQQFATVGPASATRLEVCLNLPETPAGDRLEAPSSGMLPRRVRLSAAQEFDDELRTWLREAYARS
jgi:hypothetical protein